jgi:hypothetical protein
VSTLVAPAAPSRTSHGLHDPLRRAQAALILGAATAIALVAILYLVTTSSGDGAFHHAGDYVLTANGIPYVVCLLVLLGALRTLQQRRDGRLGQAGIALASVGSAVLLAIFVYGLAAGTESSFGPGYVLASLATIVGVALFAAGSWRVGLLPRRLLALWVVAWAIGSMLPILRPGPLLLAGVYLAMGALLERRRRGEALLARPSA